MGEPARFKQADLKRAVKAVTDAGVRIGRILIDPTGTIMIEPEGGVTSRKPSSLDRFL